MRKMRGIPLLLAFIFVLQCMLPAVSASEVGQVGTAVASDPSVEFGSHSVDAKYPLGGTQKMLKTADAVILYEMNSDTLLYTWQPDKQLQPASLVKILVAMIALKKGNLEDTVTVTANALAALPGNSATLNLQPGEQFTLEQMLYALLVGSANDAAVVIAEHISGSQQSFLDEMNALAKELGCTGSFFNNTHGIYQEGMYTTARDILRIMKAALENETFVTIFGTAEYTLPETPYKKERLLQTSNYLMSKHETKLYFDSRVTGGRTGVNSERKRSIVVTAESKGLRYISIVMDAIPTFDVDNISVLHFGNYEETLTLLKYAFNNFKITEVFGEREVLGQVPVINGANHAAYGPLYTVSTVLPVDVTKDDLLIQYSDRVGDIAAPLQEGTQLNTVQAWYNSVCLAYSPVVVRNSVEHKSQETDVLPVDPTPDRDNKVYYLAAGILLGAGICVLIVIYLRKVFRSAAVRNQQKRRRRSRRRSR